jgi:murein DD-endopeptidase MepM/ murein hydrolase activator NlpD
MIYIFSMVVVLYITGYELKMLHTELVVKDVRQNGVDYDAFRNFKITDEMLSAADQEITHILKVYPKLKNKAYIDALGYLAFNNMALDYDTDEFGFYDSLAFLRGIAKVAATPGFQEVYGYYSNVFSDIKYFPVPKINVDYDDIGYTDSWYVLRKYGGNRRHEGTDLMDPNDIPGFFPVISITDGVVENMGWLEKGGYRIGIRSVSGVYFYYAHLNSYAPELMAGDRVIAGQLLGFIGDSGYGPEGTTGKFDVHLHLGIYVPTDTGDMSINPYWVLKLLEKKRTVYQYE